MDIWEWMLREKICKLFVSLNDVKSLSIVMLPAGCCMAKLAELNVGRAMFVFRNCAELFRLNLGLIYHNNRKGNS